MSQVSKGTLLEIQEDESGVTAFLGSLEADIRTGRRVRPLPDALVCAMLANAGHGLSLDGDIEGSVVL